MRYQIRTDGLGLALVDAPNAHDALMLFFEQMGKTVDHVLVDKDGNPTFVTPGGLAFYTEPPG